MTAQESRSDHMAWCKSRAVSYIDDGDLLNAFASFCSDIRKHPETYTTAAAFLLANVGFPLVTDGDSAGFRKFIEGFA